MKLEIKIYQIKGRDSTMYVKIKNAMTGEELMVSTSKLTTISQIKEDIFKK